MLTDNVLFPMFDMMSKAILWFGPYTTNYRRQTVPLLGSTFVQSLRNKTKSCSEGAKVVLWLVMTAPGMKGRTCWKKSVLIALT